MLPHRDSWITRILLFIFFILIIVYGLYEAQGLLFGPKIKVATETAVVHDPYVKIEGQALRITSLSMNGKDIPVTETGNFSEPFLLASGDNKITLEAKDTYGRTTTSEVDMVYVPESPPASSLQTSTTTSNLME
jgi:hypothetical protein